MGSDLRGGPLKNQITPYSARVEIHYLPTRPNPGTATTRFRERSIVLHHHPGAPRRTVLNKHTRGRVRSFSWHSYEGLWLVTITRPTCQYTKSAKSSVLTLWGCTGAIYMSRCYV